MVDRPTDEPTDEPTDQPTDQPADRQTIRLLELLWAAKNGIGATIRIGQEIQRFPVYGG